MAQDYPGSTSDRQGAGGAQEEENRRVREEQARKLNESLGIEGGNLESFRSGRSTYEEYKKDQEARTRNTPGDDNGDGKDDRYSVSNDGGGDARPAASSSGGDWGQVAQQATPAPPAAPAPDPLLVQLMERLRAQEAAQAAAEAERKARADALYTQLQGRAQQSLAIDPTTDPTIKNQVDYFRAEQERARRNAISNAAEEGGPLGDTRKRMAAERVGQATGAFQAELAARELTGRRAEIANALASMGGMLSTDQQAGLQRELAQMDNAIKQYQLGISDRELGLNRELGLGDLGLRRELGLGDLSLRKELGLGDLGLRKDLGFAGLDLDRLKAELMNRQFYADLGLRAEDQSNYWRDPLRTSATRR